MFAFGQFVATWWPWLLGAVGLILLVASNPAGSLMVWRWLVGTERGRYLLVAALVVGSLCWLWTARFAAGYSAGMAECARKNTGAAKVAVKQAAKRDEQSDTATKTARESGEQRKTESSERIKRAEGIAHAPRPPVPVDCPEPDRTLYDELQDGSGRLRAAEDRLRNLRATGN